jgi:hypothetical protein
MSLKANVITIFSPQLTTDQQPQASNTQSSYINQIIYPSSLFHTTIFILQLLFLPSVSPPDCFHRHLTASTISFAVSSIFNPRSWNQPHFEAQVEFFQYVSLPDQHKGERRGTIWATFSIEICHLSTLNHINSNSQSHKWNDCITSWYPSTKEGVLFITAILWSVVVHSTTFIGKRDVDGQKRWVDCC